MKRLLSCVPVFVVLSLLAGPASAEAGVWSSLGPEGGIIGSLAADPFASDTVYAGTDGGLFKTIDGGQTWRLVSPPTGWAYVLAFVGETIYASFWNRGLVRSSDGGSTWSSVPGLPPAIIDVAGDPHSPNRIWATNGLKLYVSTDGGATWSGRRKPVNKRPQPLTDLAIDPAGSWVYLLATNGFFRSGDSGKTWQLGEGIHGKSYLWQLAIDSENPAVLYLSTTSELFRSEDRGSHWVGIAAETIGDGFIRDVAVLAGSVYISIPRQGIFSSSDGGATWTRAAQGPAEPVALAAASEVLYASSEGNGLPGGLFRSFDRGESWERTANKGLKALSITAVAVDPSDSQILYAGATSTGVMKSADRGATWRIVAPELEQGEPLGSVREILVEPSHPATLYAIGESAGLVRSLDRGETWQRMPPNRGFLAMALDPRQPGALWAAGYSGVFHSADGGEHWTQVPVFTDTGMIWQQVEVDPHDLRVVYVAGWELNETPEIRLFRSEDGAATWQRRDTGIEGSQVSALAIDPAMPNRLFAGTDKGLYHSNDSGLTWTRLRGIGGRVDEVAVAPTTPMVLYAAVAGYGIKRTVNVGQSWTPARRGLGETPVYDLTIDPQDPRRLYAGTSFRGLFAWDEPPPSP